MITVLGHINPDTDTVTSAIVWAWFLNERGIEATARIAGEIPKEPAFVLEKFGVSAPALITELKEDETFALVDTNNPEELVTGWGKAKLVSIVDHHKLVGGLKTSEPIPVRIDPVACTATVIHSYIEEAGLTPPKEIASLMAAAIISDTLNLTSPTTTDHDREVLQKMASIAELDVNELADGMFAAKSDLSGMTPLDILMVDSKLFTVNEKNVRVSVLETTKPDNALAMREAIVEQLVSMKQKEELYSAFLFVVDIVKSESTVIVSSQAEEEVIHEAFCVDGLVLPGIVSRKKQIIPELERALQS